MTEAGFLRTAGYLVSTASVTMLGAVSWHSTQRNPTMRWLLLGGMAASLLGMALRWVSHWAKKDTKKA